MAYAEQAEEVIKDSTRGSPPRWLVGLVLISTCVARATLDGQDVASNAPEAETPERTDRVTLMDSLLESRPQADADPLLRIDLTKGRAVAYLVGHVTWSYTYQGDTVHLDADRLVIEARIPEASAQGSREGDASRDAGTSGEAGSPGLKDSIGGVVGRVREFRFFAEGNVRIEVPRRHVYLEADSLYYEHLSGLGVGRNVRLKMSYAAAREIATTFQASSYVPVGAYRAPDQEAPEETPLVVRASILRLQGFEWFGGRDVVVSTCEFAIPHFSLHADAVDVFPVGQEGASEEPRIRPTGAVRERASGAQERPGQAPWMEDGREGIEGRDFMIDPEGTWVTAFDHRIVPLPISRWDTRWRTQVPIRSVDLGSSSQFGFFGGVNWNVNYLLNLIPREAFPPLASIGESARLGFETNYMEKRGFSWGPNVVYGSRPSGWQPWQLQLSAWNYYGEAQYFAIQDHGDEDRSSGLPPPVEDRYWGHVWHRSAIPYVGLLDLEISKLSDRAFLREYFESVAKDGKEQETLAYLRRNILDDLAVTALYKVRANDFQSDTERVPEGKVFLLQQPVLETGLYTDLQLQAAYLRKLEDDALGIDPLEYGRFDVLNEWTYPVDLVYPYFQIRPFALARYSVYGETVDPSRGTEDRASFGAGVTVSQEWSRVFHLDRDSFLGGWLGTTLRHNVVPEFTYLNRFSNDLPSEDVVQVDRVDQVDLTESFTLSLRNQVMVREQIESRRSVARPLLQNRDGTLETAQYRTRPLFDSSIRFVLYPQPNRDNYGDTSSLMILDNTAWLSDRVFVRGWFELDPNRDFHGERIDAAVGWEAVKKTLWLTVGDRFSRDRTNYVYTMASCNLTDKWSIDAYYAHDFETGRDVQYSFTVARILHRFVVSVELSVDVGENRNQGVYFGFSPVELWRPKQGRGLSRF